MDSHKLSQLRKKLQALQFKESLDDSSAPLVDKLVTDLLHTTDSYRDLKLQVANKAQELEDGRNKVCKGNDFCWLALRHRDFSKNHTSCV